VGKTVDELSYIYDLARDLMGAREGDYEGSWKREGINSAVASAYKKASQIETMFRNNRLFENPQRSKEDCLDGINYLIFTYRFIDLNGDKEKLK
jgi:hypothetical protein